MPPKPEREEMPEVQSIKDMAKLVAYYEKLVSSWEKWGEKTEKVIEAYK